MQYEAYLVCVNRKDGKMPDPVKCDEKIYFLIKQAEKQLAKMTEEIGPYYGIYKTTIETVERVK